MFAFVVINSFINYFIINFNLFLVIFSKCLIILSIGVATPDPTLKNFIPNFSFLIFLITFQLHCKQF